LWSGNRPHDRVARSVTSLVKGLAELDPLLAEWFLPTGSPSPRSTDRFDPNWPTDKIVSIATQHAELPQGVDLFMFDLWNGRLESESAGLNVVGLLTIGAKDIAASVILRLPKRLSAVAVDRAFRVLVASFEPDIAAFMDDNMPALRAGHPAGPVLYVARGRYAVGKATSEVEVQPVDENGWLLRVSDWASIKDAPGLEVAIARLDASIHRIPES
jgi:hypothetical protein